MASANRSRKAPGQGLQLLGAATSMPASPDEARLERVPNPHPRKIYLARFTQPEFTSLCPVTGQPDFATITLTYTPHKKCVEMKSLKLYYLSFRNKGIFYEAAVNSILDDLVDALDPVRMTIEGDFAVRGGTRGVIICRHQRKQRSK